MNQRLQEIWILITDDKKKAGMLGGLTVVLFLMGIRVLVSGSPDPASAGGTSTVDDALNTNSIQTLASIDGVSDADLVVVPASEPVSRDLFEIEEAYFPQTAQTDQSEQSGGKSESGTTETTGVGTEEPSISPEERIAEEASAFELRSTLVGENPVAILVTDSGQAMVSTGDTISGFTVVEIRSRAVLLEKDSVRVTVERD